MAENVAKPVMYACASRVKMPQVGADETTFKPVKDEFKVHPSLPPKKPPHGLNKYYIKKISTGLSFSEDVIKERSFHTLPYDKKYLLEALDVSDLIKRPPPKRKYTGRHNASGPDLRHMPCHISTKIMRKLKPIASKNEKKEGNLQLILKNLESGSGTTSESFERQGDAVFLTETNPEPDESRPSTPPRKVDNQWDEYLLSIMSKTTAEWIVKQRVKSSQYRERLEGFLEDRYGPLTEGEPELIKDTVSEVDYDARELSGKSSWKKADVNMLEKVHKETVARGLPTDPYSDDNLATFYRRPAGFRRTKKYQAKEEAGAINSTAHKIEVNTYKPPPPPTLKDYINPKVGDKIYDTDNRFVQEWLTGTKQVYQKDGDERVIVMDSNNRYRKSLEKECPQEPDVWYHHDEEQIKPDQAGHSKMKKLQRGLKRWKALPESIDPNERLMSAKGVDSQHGASRQDTAQKINDQPTAVDMNASKKPECGKKNLHPTNVLLRIVDDWRSKWQLDMRYTDATPEQLIRDMADIHPHIRLKAITTCARAAEYMPPPGMGIQLNSEATKMEHVKLLPEELFIALELCLNDENLQVKRAAAVALYTLNRPTPKAEDILREALCDEKAVDRWTAAQCLAYFGECDSDVVSELISQLMVTEDTVKHEQAATLLSRLSENSTLVHSMIGEQLNSSSWRHRIMACHILPKLEGHINKDLVNKLTHLMWSDWHHEVRTIAAQTLGKTGHGRHIHDELRDKIINGNERMRVEAVSKVGQLGIMTAKLLVAFLQCFTDHYVSVRIEVCIACSRLQITDEQVLDRLVDLATYDPIWKVKALAIQALGTIGLVNKAIHDCVLWAFRYEDQAGVRVEACNTIRKFGLREPEVAHILQDRYLVESSDIVKEEIIAALEMFDISPAEDLDMVTQIKDKVRKLCTRNNICGQITVNDKEVQHEQNVERLIYQPPDTPRRNKDTPRHQPASRKLTRVPSGGAPPRVLTTSEGSGRPFSQETTDREIQAIFDRYDDESSSRGTTNPESRLSDSIPDTTFSEKSAKSQATGNDSDVGRASRPKSYVTFASPEAEQIQAEDDDDDTRSGSETMATRRRDRSLGEAQTYVEITGNPEEPGDFSEHVVAVAHSSPEGSEMTSAGDFSDVSRMITSQTDDGMSVTPYVEDDGDDPVVVHVSHSPNDEDGPGDPEGKRRSENPTKVVTPESVQDRRNDGQTIQKADSVDEAPLSEHQVNSTDVTAKDGDSREENPEDVHQSDTAVPEGDKRE